MKTLYALAVILAFTFNCSCSGQSERISEKETVSQADDIAVYYFHYTKRCVTCNAVEDETKMVIETFYGDEMKEGKIEFKSVNLDEYDGKNLAKSLRVSGQTLLIVKGKKKVDLTSQGFMNARTNPEKFHNVLQNNFDKLL